MRTSKNIFKLGQLVNVNTGGATTQAIIDYPTIRKYESGEYVPWFKPSVRNFDALILCRFTTDISKCWVGGAEMTNDATKNILFPNAQYIPIQYVKAA